MADGYTNHPTESGWRSETDAAWELAQLATGIRQEPQGVGGVPFLLLPQGVRVQSLEALLPEPLRRKGHAILLDVESFVSYVNRFKDETTLIFADPKSATVRAELAFHHAGPTGAARHADHSAALALPFSREWRDWTSRDRKWIGQVDFAEFVEEHMGQIAEPAGADLSSVAKHLEATKEVSFKSAMRLEDGSVSFRYEESVKGAGGITVPTEFTLYLPVFERAEPIQVKAKLRYRIHERALSFAFHLHRPDLVQEDAFKAVLDRIADGAATEVLLGSVSTG